jgi:hypothetical protein
MAFELIVFIRNQPAGRDSGTSECAPARLFHSYNVAVENGFSIRTPAMIWPGFRSSDRIRAAPALRAAAIDQRVPEADARLILDAERGGDFGWCGVGASDRIAVHLK